MELTDTEQQFMEKAFEYAYEALAAKEVPVGCIFVYKDEIVALGRNTVNESRNATRHAEINCIEQVTDYCRDKGLDLGAAFRQVCVYVTVEPCIMCINALYDLGVHSRGGTGSNYSLQSIRYTMRPELPSIEVEK